MLKHVPDEERIGLVSVEVSPEEGFSPAGQGPFEVLSVLPQNSGFAQPRLAQQDQARGVSDRTQWDDVSVNPGAGFAGGIEEVSARIEDEGLFSSAPEALPSELWGGHTSSWRVRQKVPG
jgi:hypothetical protein